MSYSIYKSRQAPMGIERCLQASVVYPNEPCLVVAKTSLLQLFRLSQQGGPPAQSSSSSTTASALSRPTLQLLLERKMHGNIESLNRVRFPGHSRDSLVVTFLDAKVSILEWDPAAFDLRVRSLHFFEQDIYKAGRFQFEGFPVMEVDTKQQCGVMVIYENYLAVVPFNTKVGLHEDLEMESEEGNLQSYVISLFEMGIRNVKDYKFLHGYFEPTLAVLYEPNPTWTGRAALSNKTCNVVVISLSLGQRLHPIVWSVESLPYDSYQLMSVPEPLGGVLAFATNQLLYFNQNNRYGLQMNQKYKMDTTFDLENAEVEITLDSAHATFLAPERMLVSLRGGELYLFHFVSDARTIKKITVNKAGSSVLTSCMCTLPNNLLFLGSRLGDSILIQYSENKLTDLGEEEEDTVERPEKRMKLFDNRENGNQMINGGPAGYSEQGITDEEAELMLYSSSRAEDGETAVTTYNFAVCDSLLNIGPVGDTAIGISMDSASNSHAEYDQKITSEVVTCSGYGKNGSVCVLQEGIRPELVTAFDLPGIRGAWALHHKSKSSTEEDFHSYLILSREKSSMVLETSEQLSEVSDKVDLFVKGPTYDAGNLVARQCIVQVYSGFVCLYEGVTKVQEIAVEGEIISSSISDPYVLLLIKGGSVLLFRVSSNPPRLERKDLAINQEAISACSLFLDDGAVFSAGSSEEDDMLYGTEDAKEVLLALTREMGGVEIYGLSDFTLRFRSPIFARGPSVLYHTEERVSKGKRDAAPSFFSTADKPTGPSTDIYVEEIKICYLDKKSSLPYLLAFLNSGDLLIYRGFLYKETRASTSKRPIRFSKWEHDLITRRFKASQKMAEGFKFPRFKPFENISDKQGVFICGHRPAWLFCERSHPRIHKMHLDRQIHCFEPFHNVNCTRGFIYFTSEGIFKMCQFPLNISLDGGVLIRKIPQRTTAHKISYMKDTKTYALIVSSNIPRTVEREDDYQGPSEEPHIPTVQPFDEKFEMRLITPGVWETVDKYEFELYETVLCVQECYLKSNQDKREALKPYLVVGTGYSQGEDVAMKGRIIIFEVIPPESQYFDPNATEAPKPKLKIVLEKEQKGAVSVVSSVSGYLLIAIGPKLILYNFSDALDLIGMAFYDAQIFIVSVNTVKNFVLCGDIYKSIFFLRWREDGRQLYLLAKDYNPLAITASEFIVLNQSLNFITADDNKNVEVFSYAPQSLESRGGQMLLCKSDFHLGATVEKFVRVKMNPVLKDSHRNAVVFGTHDGSFGFIAPIDELVFKRLLALQTRMTNYLPHFAGLNPRAFRNTRPERKLNRNVHQNVLDGELLWRYLHLDLGEQRRLAKGIGTTVDQVMENLLEIDLSCSLF